MEKRRCRNIEPIDIVWMILIRIRLALFKRVLAHRYGVALSTVPDVLITWVNYLYVMLVRQQGSRNFWKFQMPFQVIATTSDRSSLLNLFYPITFQKFGCITDKLQFFWEILCHFCFLESLFLYVLFLLFQLELCSEHNNIKKKVFDLIYYLRVVWSPIPVCDADTW